MSDDSLEKTKIEVIEKIYKKYTALINKLEKERKELITNFLKEKDQKKIKELHQKIMNIKK